MHICMKRIRCFSIKLLHKGEHNILIQLNWQNKQNLIPFFFYIYLAWLLSSWLSLYNSTPAQGNFICLFLCISNIFHLEAMSILPLYVWPKNFLSYSNRFFFWWTLIQIAIILQLGNCISKMAWLLQWLFLHDQIIMEGLSFQRIIQISEQCNLDDNFLFIIFSEKNKT